MGNKSKNSIILRTGRACTLITYYLPLLHPSFWPGMLRQSDFYLEGNSTFSWIVTPDSICSISLQKKMYQCRCSNLTWNNLWCLERPLIFWRKKYSPFPVISIFFSIRFTLEGVTLQNGKYVVRAQTVSSSTQWSNRYMREIFYSVIWQSSNR